MHPLKLRDEIFVLTALIKTMDDLHDLGVTENISLEELQSIYSRIKVLKSARGLLVKKIKQVKKDIFLCPVYLQLVQRAKERVLN
jgi:hypothetical protein